MLRHKKRIFTFWVFIVCTYMLFYIIFLNIPVKNANPLKSIKISTKRWNYFEEGIKELGNDTGNHPKKIKVAERLMSELHHPEIGETHVEVAETFDKKDIQSDFTSDTKHVQVTMTKNSDKIYLHIGSMTEQGKHSEAEIRKDYNIDTFVAKESDLHTALKSQTGVNNHLKTYSGYETRLRYLEGQMKDLKSENIKKAIDVEKSEDAVTDSAVSMDKINMDNQITRRKGNRSSKKTYANEPNEVDVTTKTDHSVIKSSAAVHPTENSVMFQAERLKRVPMNDFDTYPCLRRHNATYLASDHCIRSVNVASLSRDVSDFECVKLQLNVPIDICIHDPRKDRFISLSLLVVSSWEGQLLDNFTKALDFYNVTDVLDIGCNIGVYTLAAAHNGKRVVAIDANVENLRLVSKSLILNRLTKNVTLIWNAVSDEYTPVTLSDNNDRNIGGNYIRRAGNASAVNGVIVETIRLTDIENLFSDRSIAIKMDIEGSELNAFIGGIDFMKNVNIRFIQIEIAHHRNRVTGRKIVLILETFNFVPFRSCLGDQELTYIPILQWPYDVCFIKRY